MIVEIVCNGQTRSLPRGTTVAELLTELDLERRPVAVEINRQVVPKFQHPVHALAEGDQVEIVTLVGGG